jgi:hypothetical protein
MEDHPFSLKDMKARDHVEDSGADGRIISERILGKWDRNMWTGALSLGLKLPGREADYSPPSSAEAKNAWSCTSTTRASSWIGV